MMLIYIIQANHDAMGSKIFRSTRFYKTTVNYPHLIGVGMSREGYGQQVDKEA